MNRYYSHLAIAISLPMNPLVSRFGWLPHIRVRLEITSRCGEKTELFADLKPTAAIDLTDCLLRYPATYGIRNTPGARRRISRYIADRLTEITNRKRDWLKHRGYPLKFTIHK